MYAVPIVRPPFGPSGPFRIVNLSGPQPPLGQGAVEHVMYQCIVAAHCTPEGIPVKPEDAAWGMGPSHTAAENDQIRKNADIIWDVVSRYPFPEPFPVGMGVALFRRDLQGDMNSLASVPGTIDKDVVRIWATLQTLLNYDTWGQEIEAAQRERARRRRRVSMTRAIVAAVASIIVGLVAPAVLMAAISAVQAAIKAYVALQKLREAAKRLIEAYRLFQETEPEFAKNVKETAELLDKLGAEEAIRETEPAAPPAAAPAGATPYIVGGGVAAAAGIATVLLGVFRR